MRKDLMLKRFVLGMASAILMSLPVNADEIGDAVKALVYLRNAKPVTRLEQTQKIVLVRI